MAHLCGVTAESFSPACGSKVPFIIRSTSPEDVCHSLQECVCACTSAKYISSQYRRLGIYLGEGKESVF